MENNDSIDTVNFDNFNIINFYLRNKNLNRIRLFNVLNEINFISFGKNKNEFAITFDGLTKIGNLLPTINNLKKYENKLNELFLNIMLNSNIGYALPIFKYDNKIYSKKNIIEDTIDINNIENIKQISDKLLNINEPTIIFNIKIIENSIIIQHKKISELKYVENE